MKPFKIIIAYDGTDYHGWQEQIESLATIASTMQNAFYKVFNHAIKVVGASRTDAGVHALGQVARFYTTLEVAPDIIVKAWNGGLPPSIHICSLEHIIETDTRLFHPQHNVKEKIYQYHFTLSRPLPFFARYCHFHAYSLDIEKMKECLQYFIGKHNFTSFCVEHCVNDNICEIDTITLEYCEFNCWQVTIKGKRFLHHMIRRMIGAALNIGSNKDLSPQFITAALENPGIYDHFPTAPAQGLILRKIVYNNEK